MSNERINALMSIALRDSSNPHEALNALHKAQKILMESGIDLTNIGDAPIPQSTPPPGHVRIDPTTNTMRIMGPTTIIDLDSINVKPDPYMIKHINQWLDSPGPHRISTHPGNDDYTKSVIGVSSGEKRHHIWAGPTGPALALSSALRTILRTHTTKG